LTDRFWGEYVRYVESRYALVVDDDPDARELFMMFLEHAGAQVASARDGVDALAAAHAHPPDVVVTDLAMPRMDGLELAHRLRADPATRHVPIIAVTGHAVMDVPRRARQAGCDAVLVKPCGPDELISTVRRFVGGRRHGVRRVRRDASVRPVERRSARDDRRSAPRNDPCSRL
jgi:CheY-like chemotaxis protein